jgi:hypothetical protein
MEEGEKSVILDLHDVLLQLATPYEILALLCREPVLSQRREDVVECRRGYCSDVQHTLRSVWQGLHGSEGSATSDMIHRYHVHSVVYIWNKAELDASLDHAPNKVVGVGHYGTPR